MVRHLSFALLVVVCFSSRLAFANEPSRSSTTPSDESLAVPYEPTETTWYGWQTLTADALSMGALFATKGDGATVGFVGYLAGAPIIHAAHGNVAKGAGSVGLRLALPVIGGGIGLAAANCNGPSGVCPFEAFGFGFLGGMGAAVVIDSAALAYERRPPRLAGVLPNVVVSHGGAVVTASGSF